MLYAKYKTRNLQGVLGPGGAGISPATTTGSSNATGGVAYTDAAYDASDMDSSYGSRLALAIQKITRIIISYFNCF